MEEELHWHLGWGGILRMLRHGTINLEIVVMQLKLAQHCNHSIVQVIRILFLIVTTTLALTPDVFLMGTHRLQQFQDMVPYLVQYMGLDPPHLLLDSMFLFDIKGLLTECHLVQIFFMMQEHILIIQ
jgi:hypothetical protein